MKIQKGSHVGTFVVLFRRCVRTQAVGPALGGVSQRQGRVFVLPHEVVVGLAVKVSAQALNALERAAVHDDLRCQPWSKQSVCKSCQQ